MTVHGAGEHGAARGGIEGREERAVEAALRVVAQQQHRLPHFAVLQAAAAWVGVGLLDPDTDRVASAWLRGSAIVVGVKAPIRRADLWILSNIAHQASLCLPLEGGIAFYDRRVATPDPELHRALLGMRPLIRAGLNLEVDFASRTFSVWAP